MHHGGWVPDTVPAPPALHLHPRQLFTGLPQPSLASTEAHAGRGSTLTAATAAGNLTLLISLVWALAHTFILLTPVVYCLLYTWGLQSYGPSRSVVRTGPASTRWGLAVWAALAGLVALLAGLATAALCLAFGSGFTVHGVSLSLSVWKSICA